MTALGVAIGGGLGAFVRYRVGGFVNRHQSSPFPLATLLVNVIGSMLLGVLVALAAKGLIPDRWLGWAGIGFCGGLTTFSTFAYETFQLVEQGSWRYAWWNIALAGPLAFGAATLGYAFGSTL